MPTETPTLLDELVLSAALKFTSPPAATDTPSPAAKSVPTKVVLPPETTLKLLPAWKEPVTASDDLAFSTVTLTPALKLLVLDWVPLVFLSSLTP